MRKPTVSVVSSPNGLNSFPLIRFGDDSNRFGMEFESMVIKFRPDDPAKITACVYNRDGGGWVTYLQGKRPGGRMGGVR